MKNTILWAKDISERERRTTEAIQEAIKKINDKHKSIHFTYQQCVKAFQFVAVWDTSAIRRVPIINDLANETITNSLRSYIHININ